MPTMMPRVALMLSLTLAVGVAWSAGPAMADGEFSAVGSINMDGGLEVITSEKHAQPLVTVDTWVRAGSASDFQGYPGIANATAAALWEGGARPLSQALATIGATTRYEVTRDATHFSATLPASKMEEGMNLIGAAFGSPNWGAVDMNGLKSRLGADWARQGADGRQVAFEALMRELYGPDYGHRVVGQPEAIARLSVADMQAFFNRYYVPANTKVVLVGDFDTRKVVRQVTWGYAALLKRTASTAAVPVRPLAPSNDRKIAGPTAQLAAGARGASLGDQREQATLAMLAHVLGGGEKSRLTRALGAQAGPVSARWEAFRGPGALVVQMATEPKSTMAVERALRDAVAELRNSPVTLDEHAQAMAALVAAYAQGNDTPSEQATTLGFYASVGGDPKLARTYPEVVRQVSRSDMMEVAQKYLSPDAIKVVVLAP